MIGILKTIIEFITKNVKLVLLILLGIAIILGLHYRDNYKQQVQETQKQIQNIEALNDSVHTYKNKAGELTSEKKALQTDKKQLKTLNKELSKELSKEKGNVKQLTQLVTQLKGDTGSVNTSDAQVVNSDSSKDSTSISRYKFTWEKSSSGDKWSKMLEGYFVVEANNSYTPKIIENKITKDLLNMEIFTGVKDINGHPTIFVRSTYPNLKFTDINGAIIDNKKLSNTKNSRWGLGIGIGYGFNTNSGTFSPVIEAGIHYNLVRF